MSKWGSPRAQLDPKPRLKSSGRKPPEPVERRPEPTPAPPMPPRGYSASDCVANPKPPCGGTAVEPPFSLPQHTFDAVASIADSFREQVDRSPLQVMVSRHILIKLERIPCMSEECDGVEDDEPVTKKNPSGPRCHRCAAVRLARSVTNGH